jgi:hypothetical protein
MAFAKLKALLCKPAERTVEGLWSAIGRLVDVFKPQECAKYFAAVGTMQIDRKTRQVLSAGRRPSSAPF